MTSTRLARLSLLVSTFLTGLLAAANATALPSARSDVYSSAAFSRFCERAQQTVASTVFAPWNVTHNDFTTFTNSSSAPYEGPNSGAFNGTLISYPSGGAFPNNLIPLISQQFVSYRELAQTQWEYPVVISCKMKDAESLNYHFGPGTAGTQRSCREVNQDTVADVFATLTAIEQRSLRFTQAQIVYLADLMTVSGPSWLYPLPYLPRVVFIPATGVNAGKLVFRAQALAVPRTNTDGGVGPDKKGVYYCHLPSAEYVRALVTGQVNPIIENPPE